MSIYLVKGRVPMYLPFHLPLKGKNCKCRESGLSLFHICPAGRVMSLNREHTSSSGRAFQEKRLPSCSPWCNPHSCACQDKPWPPVQSRAGQAPQDWGEAATGPHTGRSPVLNLSPTWGSEGWEAGVLAQLAASNDMVLVWGSAMILWENANGYNMPHIRPGARDTGQGRTWLQTAYQVQQHLSLIANYIDFDWGSQ